MLHSPFTVVVPVKALGHAKTRLRGLPRAELMRAFALDAIDAVVASPAVHATYVVTDDVELAGAAAALGAERLPDLGDGDLNRALRRAVETLTGPVAAMLGDLPCLVPDDLTAALGDLATGGHVADADGTGTTLLAAPDPGSFRPSFGPGSHAAHIAAGYPDVQLPVPSLRRDVDTAADLTAALALGVGIRTRQALAADAERGR